MKEAQRPLESRPDEDQLVSDIGRLYREGNAREILAKIKPPTGTATTALDTKLGISRAIALFDVGDVTSAIAEFRELLRQQGADGKTLFDAGFALFVRSQDFDAAAQLMPDLANLRQAAAREASAHTLTALHVAVARLEGLRGQVALAARHLHVAKSLAARLDDPAVHCALDLTEACVEHIRGNLPSSRAAAERCSGTAAKAGFKKYSVAAANNIGIVALAEGKVQRARKFIEAVVDASSRFTYARLGALDSLLQVELFEERLKEAEALASKCAITARADKVPARSWSELSHDVTLCAYHERLEDWHKVIAIADEAEPEVVRRQYKVLRTQLLSAKARALGRIGDHKAAVDTLGVALRTCPPSAVDPLIALEASRASCAALRGEHSQARAHFERALAGCRAIGHKAHERWVTRLRSEVTSSARSDAATPETPQADLGLILSDVATILGAGQSIDLLAHRTIALLEATPLAPRLHVRHENGCEHQPEPSATWQMEPDGTFIVELRGSDRRVTLTIDRVEGIDDISLVKSVIDIVQASVHRPSDTDDADEDDLWPNAVLATDEDAIFRSPRMIEVVKVAQRLATTQLPILITGETGTGKEIFARLIHEHSRNRKGPFVPFNCSAVTKDLVESQLFGHRRGAFTGATEAFAGTIRSAERGTLFLDEVGDLDPNVQPKLLRFLESGEVHAVGETRPQQVPVRVVAATNANVDDLTAQGRFRRDLFYRLGVARLVLPPLRERKDEIPALAALFASRASKECGRSGVRLSDDFVAALLLHEWPGNLRELYNEIRRLVAMAEDGAVLTASQLSPDIARHWMTRPVAPAETVAGPNVVVRLDQTLAEAISQVEQQFIDRALKATGGRVTEAANMLGLSRKGLFLKRRRRGLVASADSGEVPRERHG
jgi:DNA-binding NtrC family response regulator/tetratricopeptide (TPR) repeat protein